jgi:hypothetical protein
MLGLSYNECSIDPLFGYRLTLTKQFPDIFYLLAQVYIVITLHLSEFFVH